MVVGRGIAVRRGMVLTHDGENGVGTQNDAYWKEPQQRHCRHSRWQ
jgi:hypothetical protein